MPIRRLLIVTIAISWLCLAPPAAADCEPAGPVEEALRTAPVAFVGTVVAMEGPAARFAVAEIWAGEVGPEVEVRGLSNDGGVDSGFGAGFTEDDRRWTDGATYLVVPWVDGSVLRDSICTATTEWSDELTALRPANATILESQATGSAEPPVWIPAVAVAALVLAAGSVLAFRRR
jgi:hypothetical protein